MEGITLQEHFASLEDPRVERTKHHQLLTIITIALCAVICGADTWVDVEEFGKSKRSSKREEWSDFRATSAHSA